MSRWQTTATIAAAFALGHVFAVACGSGSKDAAAEEEEEDLSNVLAQVAELVATVAAQDAAIVALQADVTELQAQVTELQAEVTELRAFEASALCFIGHMTDDQHWFGADEEDSEPLPGAWLNIGWDHDGTFDYRNSSGHQLRGEEPWGQGVNSDAMQAWDDCF